MSTHKSSPHLGRWVRVTAYLSLLLMALSFGRGLAPGLCANLPGPGGAPQTTSCETALVAPAATCCSAILPARNKDGNPPAEQNTGRKACPFCTLICTPQEPLTYVEVIRITAITFLDVLPPTEIIVPQKPAQANLRRGPPRSLQALTA